MEKNGKVPSDWLKAVMIPLNKGKGSKTEYKNYTGISLLRIVGKVYGRIIINHLKRISEPFILKMF